VHVIDRCNLTVLEQPGQEDLPEFLAARGVEVVASLPCYLEDNVDAQRGKGVFESSIRGLQRLNALGYGSANTDLILNLVYNPQGPTLPPPQCALEADYHRQLDGRFGVRFNRLLTLSNMPIQRFGSMLLSKGAFDDYLELLRRSHRPENLDNLMCRRLLSVDWEGYVYDCDFNQMLDMTLKRPDGERLHIRQLMHQDLLGRPIQVGEHCYGCTAGQGSSCGGALEE
jgi:radical SAM/Cys-rich protein